MSATIKRVFVFCFIIGIATTADAQFSGLLKKKDKNKTETADSTRQNEPEEKEEKKKGGGFLQKMVSKVSKVAGNTVMSGAGLTSIGNLADADVIVSLGTNIYSKDLGLVFTDFLGKDWVNNGDFTMLQIASKDAFQFYKYDGSIKVNDKELKHVSMGVYTATENPGTGNKKISFEKNGTVEGSFEIPLPANRIKLLSINGQTKNAKADFTKNVTLEFSGYSTSPQSLIRIDVITTQIGIRSLSMVCYVKPSAKVVIPAAAFRNIENNNKFNFKDCYLSVSDQQMQKALNATGKISPEQVVITGSNDGMWVDVTGSNDNEKGIKFTSGNATVVKGNAAYAKPLSFAKNTAVSSFYTYGTTYLYDTDKNTWAQSTTTKTIDFPEVPDAYLETMLASLYNKITSAYTEVSGNTVLPAATVASLPAYSNTQKFMRAEVNNDGEFLKSYQRLEPVKSFTSVSNRYYGESVLLKEAKADALLKVALVCQLSWDSKPMMTPYLTVELIGEANGDFRSFMGNTKYFTMNIKGEGYELKKNKQVELDKVFQVDAFASQFKIALTELKSKEAAKPDYEQVWNLQK